MGTSQSSSGSPSGVPMVPPWVPDLPLPSPTPGSADAGEGGPPDGTPEQGAPLIPAQGTEPRQPIPIAPARRFLGANRNIGDYSRTGDGTTMRRSLGQYVKKGYGGSATATRRMAGTAQTALSGGKAECGHPI